jgi:hypothetical protein
VPAGSSTSCTRTGAFETNSTTSRAGLAVDDVQWKVLRVPASVSLISVISGSALSDMKARMLASTPGFGGRNRSTATAVRRTWHVEARSRTRHPRREITPSACTCAGAS